MIKKSGIKKTCHKERGQASIMMGIMMLTFVFFFGFVVNTGMLVHAKINLQNAADLAAYAGAAVQARQLNHISFLNYEMRRQYKKFLFRYYVLGNLAQCSFPGTETNPKCKQSPQQGGGDGAKTPMIWTPDGLKEYGSPAVCIIFNADDNYCQLDKIPEIAKAKGGGAFDSITDVLNRYLDQISDVQKDNCVAVGMGNVLTLQAWLWNLDPEWKLVNEGALKNLSVPGDNDGELKKKVENIYQVIRSLGRGLGLVPREVILRRRIETLASYVNTEPQKGVDFEAVQLMKTRTVPEPPAFERTIQAFLSAYYTLGNHTFSGSEIQLDELMSKQLLNLKDNRVKFGAFAIDFPKDQEKPGDCIPSITSDGVSSGIPVGVYKDPSILTYYAVRVRARAKLMFSPFGDLQLKAYAAAQPFGSRIGPELGQDQWTRPAILSEALTQGQPFGTGVEAIPNLPLREADGTAIGNGWDTQEAMLAMHQGFLRGDNSMPSSIEVADLDRAYHRAMSPNPGEGKKYNIPLDRDDPFVKNFDQQRVLAFWAPVFPRSMAASMNAELEKLVTEYWPGGNAIQKSTRDLIIQQISIYLESLKKGDGEQYDYNNPQTAEGFEIVRLADPVHTRGGEPVTIQVGAFSPKDLNSELRTSWDEIANKDLERGRIGYSVKLVSFQHLLGGKVKTSTSKSTMNNGFEPDPESDADLPFIKH